MNTERKNLFCQLGTWIIIATVLGAVVGLMMGPSAGVLAPLGNLFMKLIQMVVVPMVFFSILGGAASLGQSLGIGKIGVATFFYYTVTSLISVTVALVAGAVFCPGMGLDVSHIEFASLSAEEVEKAQSLPGFWDVLISFIPANPFQALAEGHILQVIVFCLFAGFALAHLPKADRDFMMRIVDKGTQICVNIMMTIMLFSPVGVFCLMADATGSFGYEVLLKLVYLIGLYILVIVLITYGMIGGSVVLFAPHVTYRKFFRAMAKVQLFAFSTSSSMATLPLNMKVAEQELHISKAITSFALPLGATINMNGTAAYNALAAVFLAQLCGMELTMAQYMALLVSSTVGAIGQAGVPGPTFLMVAILLSAGIPIETLPILFGVDRIFDMLRTPVNITGDTACAAIVERFTKNEE